MMVSFSTMAENMEMPPEEREKYHQIYEVARDAFLEQLNRIEFLDKKAQINLVVIGIVLSFGAFRTDQIANLINQARPVGLITFLQLAFLLGAFIFFTLSLLFSILTLKPRVLQAYPSVSELLDRFKDEKIQDLHASLSSHFGGVISANEGPLSRKVSHLKRSINAVLFALSSLAAFLLISAIAKIFF